MRATRLMKASLLAMAVLGAGLDASPAHAETPGSISGTVTLEGVPVEGLDVCAYRGEDVFSEGYCPTVSVPTGPDGRYQVTGLSAGEYFVRFDGDLSNYDTEWFDDAQTDLEATRITITDGDVVTGIDADLVNPFPDRAVPDDLVNALDLPSSSLVSATTNAHPDSLALGAAPMGSLPTSGSNYLIMSTGRAGEVLGGTPSERLSTDLEPSPHGVILAGGDLRPGDLTQVTLRTRPPSDAACLAFDIQFLSEVDAAIEPDIFTAELHRSHIRGAAFLDVAAPNNFAVDDRGNIVSWWTPGFGPVSGTRMERRDRDAANHDSGRARCGQRSDDGRAVSPGRGGRVRRLCCPRGQHAVAHGGM